MRIQNVFYPGYIIAIFSMAFFLRPGDIYAQQILPADPSSPIAPTEFSQCNAYSQAWSRLETEISRLHEECLNANRNNKARNESGSGLGSTCTFSACQSLHTRKYEVQSRKGPEVESCYDEVKKYRENERLRREAEEQRRREAEEREERARAEQKEKEAAKREREQAEKEKRSDEAQRAREREETNRKLIQLAAEQQRLEREALARRTEERQRQMEELKKRKDEANEQYQQNVDKQTRSTQDDLLAQLQNKAGTENTVFPPPDPNKNAGQEFDLSSAGSNASEENAAAGSLPELPSQFEDSIAPQKDSYFSNAFRNVRDFASPILEKGKTIFVEQLRDIAQENLNEVRDTIVTGVFDDHEGVRTAENMVRKYFDNSYKDPTREMLDSAFNATAGGLVDEAASDISKSVAKSLGETSPHAGLVGALADVAIKNGAEKLSEYARNTFVDSMSGKVSEAYRNISEKLIGPTDPVTQPVQDAAILRLPALLSKMGSPTAAAKAVYDYGTNMVNAMGEMFDRLMKSEFFGTAPPDNDPDK